MANDQVHQTHQLRHEENESEDSEAKDRMRGYFAADIFIEQAHICARPF
jgi:hypothetical protein